MMQIVEHGKFTPLLNDLDSTSIDFGSMLKPFAEVPKD